VGYTDGSVWEKKPGLPLEDGVLAPEVSP